MKHLLPSVIEAAILAGQAIMHIYENTDSMEMESKDDGSPLTNADLKANQIIVSSLQKLEEKLPIISEENKAIDWEERKTWKKCWMVDPLDGTKEFIKKNGEFTVNIALIEDNEPILGVVYIPVQKRVFYAVKGEGAFEMTAESTFLLSANEIDVTRENLKVVSSRSHMNEKTKTFLSGLKKPEIVSAGSSLKFLLIAQGQADIYPRLAPTMEWDTAAAHIILEEAGGTVLQAETKFPLSYNKKDLLNPHFIAYGKITSD